ncbi:MAG: ATP-binding protein, partial [Clostridia bacterium]|nr:ATP-binding protein [Clostridia bacterium]
YVKKSGGGLLLYGPPGTGKTMIAAAIANEIGAKFCSVKPSDLLHQGAGQSEKAIKALFQQARQFPCAVVYFDEMDSISPKNTRSQYAKQLRSEFLAQLQGIESYGKDTGNILFLIAATNKPWDIDSAFIRPGRFGTRIYVGLPDSSARNYIIESRIAKIMAQGLVSVSGDIQYEEIVEKTEGFNCSDIANLLDKIEEISIIRGVKTGVKSIIPQDFDEALEEIKSSVQRADI